MVKNGIDKQKQEINKEPEVKDENKLLELSERSKNLEGYEDSVKIDDNVDVQKFLYGDVDKEQPEI